MTTAERERSTRRVARLATIPVAVGLLATLKGLASAAGIGAMSAVLLIGGVLLITDPPLRSATPSGSAGRDVDIPVAAPAAPPASPLRVELPSSAPPADGPASLSPAVRPAPPAGDTSSAGPLSSANTASPEAPEVEPAPSSVALPEPDSLLREALLLDEARAMLASSPAGALSRLEQHAREFPHGKLGLEREILTLEALTRTGRRPEAIARGQALLARVAGTPYEPRVRAMLGNPP
ncbi:MAG: hypothetical protein R3B70_10100 [Polyangiaceae bacterium]